MAISKKELTEGIQNNDFREALKMETEGHRQNETAILNKEPEENQAITSVRRKVYMTGQKPKGRPKTMEGYGRVRLSLYISEELDNRIEKLLDRNKETKNQLMIRLIEQSCEENEKMNKKNIH